MAKKDDQSATDENKSPNGDDEKLGEAGKKALEAEREARKELEAKVAKLTKAAEKAEQDKQASEDAKKDELQKAQESLAELQSKIQAKEAADLRFEIASEKVPEGTPLAKVRSLARRLTGETKEELEKDADEFIADVFPAKGSDAGKAAGKEGKSKEDEGAGEESYLGPRGTPKEDLVSGATNKPASHAEADDPDKLAKAVFESTRI